MSLLNFKCRQGLVSVTVSVVILSVSALTISALPISALPISALSVSALSVAHAQPVIDDQKKITQGQGSSERERIESKVVSLRLQLEKMPSDQTSLMSLSQLLLRLSNYQEALTHLRAVVKLSPEFSKGRYLLAFTLRKLKRYREAIKEYEAFLGISSDQERLSGVYGLAKTLDLVGDPKGAIELYQEFIEQEKRPSQKRWIDEAKESLIRLRASDVVLIDSDIDEDNAPTESVKSLLGSSQKRPFNKVLAEAEQHFAERKYAQAEKLFVNLVPRDIPDSMKIRLCYYASVSAYLAGHFLVAQTFAERGLMMNEGDPSLRGMAVLSHLQHKRSKSSKGLPLNLLLPQVRLALKEGRFHDCLRMINQHMNGTARQSEASKADVTLDPLLLHAKGRALLGLKRYGEAYQALNMASKGLSYPHLYLDLAVAANALRQPKLALKHYQTLKELTRPQSGQMGSALYRQAEQALEAL